MMRPHNLPNYAVPGLGPPPRSKKQESRRFFDPRGDLTIVIDKRLDSPELVDPLYTITISKDTGREVPLVFADGSQSRITKEKSGGWVLYRFKLNADSFATVRGTYFLRVLWEENNGQVREKKFSVTLENHPFNPRRDEYQWENAEPWGAQQAPTVSVEVSDISELLP